jgi:hypothetical protein
MLRNFVFLLFSLPSQEKIDPIAQNLQRAKARADAIAEVCSCGSYYFAQKARYHGHFSHSLPNARVSIYIFNISDATSS